jgi:hypothetical protein
MSVVADRRVWVFFNVRIQIKSRLIPLANTDRNEMFVSSALVGTTATRGFIDFLR